MGDMRSFLGIADSVRTSSTRRTLVGYFFLSRETAIDIILHEHEQLEWDEAPGGFNFVLQEDSAALRQLCHRHLLRGSPQRASWIELDRTLTISDRYMNLYKQLIMCEQKPHSSFCRSLCQMCDV